MVELVGESREIVANILGNDFEILREISKIKPIHTDFSVFRAENLYDDLKTWHIGIPIGSHPVDAEVVLKEESIINKGFTIIVTMKFMKCKNAVLQTAASHLV